MLITNEIIRAWVKLKLRCKFFKPLYSMEKTRIIDTRNAKNGAYFFAALTGFS